MVISGSPSNIQKIKKNIMNIHLSTTLLPLIKVYQIQTFYHIYF